MLEPTNLLVFVAGISLLDGWQQHRSRRALAELARLSAPRAHVRRQGQELVWLNGEPRHPLTQLGAAIGLGLWLLVQAMAVARHPRDDP